MSEPESVTFLEMCVRAACVLEATAPKVGNVHPQASFSDLRFEDFLESAELAAPPLARTRSMGVGTAVYHAIAATRRRVQTNTNLGIALLLAPLAAVDVAQPLAEGLETVLARLTVEDARDVYAAIRLGNPGGLGRVAKQDVREAPTTDLRSAMRLAAAHDLIAMQYTNGFRDVFRGLTDLLDWQRETCDLLQSILGLQLTFMSRHPDSLIARKCGADTARDAMQRAQAVLKGGWPGTPSARRACQDLDSWLRADGNRRNPGTTADMICAILFAAFRAGELDLPARFADQAPTLRPTSPPHARPL